MCPPDQSAAGPTQARGSDGDEAENAETPGGFLPNSRRKTCGVEVDVAGMRGIPLETYGGHDNFSASISSIRIVKVT